MAISIDIVIPHYKDIEALEAMMSAMAQTDIPRSLKNIFIVENGPKSGAMAVCINYQNKLPAKYLYSERTGLANARNLGIENSIADFVIFLDNDLFLNSDSLTNYEKSFLYYGQQYFYGGPVKPRYSFRPIDWKLAYVPASVKGFSPYDEDKIIDEGIFLGGNHALSRNCISAMNGKVYQGDSATSTGGGVGEEHRLQTSLLALNFRGVYVSKAIVHHPVPEECFTLSWICNRRYRRGLTDSKRAGFNESKLYFAGIPFWVISHYLKNTGLIFLNKLIMDQKKEMKYGVRRSWAKGFIDGVLGKDRNRK
jgi:glycosyltransferase involved in cell wall biosynthesis